MALATTTVNSTTDINIANTIITIFTTIPISIISIDKPFAHPVFLDTKFLILKIRAGWV